MGHVLDALRRLETLAEAGASPDEVAHDAAVIAAGWWWNARGDLAPDRLVLLVQELRPLVCGGVLPLRAPLGQAGAGRAAGPDG